MTLTAPYKKFIDVFLDCHDIERAARQAGVNPLVCAGKMDEEDSELSTEIKKRLDLNRVALKYLNGGVLLSHLVSIINDKDGMTHNKLTAIKMITCTDFQEADVSKAFDKLLNAIKPKSA